MGTMACSLLWVMQDSYHQPQYWHHGGAFGASTWFRRDASSSAQPEIALSRLQGLGFRVKPYFGA